MVILGKALFSFQWLKGIIILASWYVASGLLEFGVIGFAIMIFMNVCFLGWLYKKDAE
jgi:hypothetical protein